MQVVSAVRAAFLGALLVLVGVPALHGDVARAGPDVPQFKFTGEPPMPLRAASLVIEEAYRTGGGVSTVEQNYKAAPADIARGWARDRIRLVGATGTVTVRIVDARVTEKKLEVKKGLVGLFKDEQDRELNARLEVQILYTHPQGNGAVAAAATATRTLGEHMSMNQAEESYYMLLRELANAFDTAMSAEVQTHLVGL